MFLTTSWTFTYGFWSCVLLFIWNITDVGAALWKNKWIAMYLIMCCFGTRGAVFRAAMLLLVCLISRSGYLLYIIVVCSHLLIVETIYKVHLMSVWDHLSMFVWTFTVYSSVEDLCYRYVWGNFFSLNNLVSSLISLSSAL